MRMQAIIRTRVLHEHVFVCQARTSISCRRSPTVSEHHRVGAAQDAERRPFAAAPAAGPVDEAGDLNQLDQATRSRVLHRDWIPSAVRGAVQIASSARRSASLSLLQTLSNIQTHADELAFDQLQRGSTRHWHGGAPSREREAQREPAPAQEASKKREARSSPTARARPDRQHAPARRAPPAPRRRRAGVRSWATDRGSPRARAACRDPANRCRGSAW
jgi:hypothetical protein